MVRAEPSSNNLRLSISTVAVTPPDSSLSSLPVTFSVTASWAIPMMRLIAAIRSLGVTEALNTPFTSYMDSSCMMFTSSRIMEFAFHPAASRASSI